MNSLSLFNPVSVCQFFFWRILVSYSFQDDIVSEQTNLRKGCAGYPITGLSGFGPDKFHQVLLHKVSKIR